MLLLGLSLLLTVVDSQDEVRRLVEKLRSEKVEEREEAFSKLRELGEVTAAELEKAATSDDAEMATRARALLESFTPAGTIRRIEERLLRRRSAKIRIRVAEVTTAGEEERTQALLSLKEGNRVRFEMDPGRYWKEFVMVSNGKTGWSSSFPGSSLAVAGIRDRFAMMIVRMGMEPQMLVELCAQTEEESGPTLASWNDRLRVESARFGPEQGGKGTIFYKAGGIEMELTYDRSTLQPVRRKKKGDPAVVESYLDWTLEGELPDELFRVPADRIEEQTRLLGVKPRNGAAWAERAAARMEAAQWDEALKDFTRAIEFDPKSFRAYAGRGNLRMLQGKDEEAMPDLDRAVEIDPRESRVRVDRGWARVRTGRFKDAVEDCTVAVEIDPNSLGAWVNRGVARILLDEPAKGLPDFDAAQRIDPKWPTVYSNRALALAVLNQDQEALAQADRALALDSQMPYYAHAAKGLVFLRQGRRGEALSEFSRFETRVLPKDPLMPRFEKWKAEAER
jgi:tetratricopeptide (TPR) repeat protein